MNKELCDCGKVATWCYMPGYSDGNPNNCDDCVPRGCTCNYQYVSEEVYQSPGVLLNSPQGIDGKDWKWIEPGKIWTDLDQKGREYPCCEHMHLPFGWDEENGEQ